MRHGERFSNAFALMLCVAALIWLAIWLIQHAPWVLGIVVLAVCAACWAKASDRWEG